MTAQKRIYLAGPDVFLRNATELFAKKKAICAAHGFTGVSPLDNELDLSGQSKAEAAMNVSRGNERTMDDCDLIVANMTPFRGPSTDVGTAYEMGYMRAQGKPVFAYTNNSEDYLTRVAHHFGVSVKSLALRSGTDVRDDPDGMYIEPFGLRDNLMLIGAVDAQKADVSAPSAGMDLRFQDLECFTAAVRSAKEYFSG